MNYHIITIWVIGELIGEGTPDPTNNYSFEVKGITQEISKYIQDIDEFNKAIKQYIVDNHYVNVTNAEVQKYEYQESTSRLGIVFKLDNPKEDKIRVIVNPDGKIDISKYE